MSVPDELKKIPNQLTALRIVLSVALYWLVGDRGLFLAVLFLAAATDVLDGQIARRLGQASAFGLAFDSLADRFLIASGVLCLWRMRPEVLTAHAPLWAFLAVSLAIPQLAAFVKLRRSAWFHLYTGKAAYLVAFCCYIWTVWAGDTPVLNWLLVGGLTLKSVESTAVCLLVEDPYANLRPSIFLYRRSELSFPLS